MDKILYVIAGPNGAGKSTFGKVTIPEDVPFFNGDKIFKDYLDRNPNDSKRDAHEHVQNIFEGTVQTAVSEKKPFAYETNFADPSALTTPRYFKAHGYKLNMIYYALSSIQDAEKRVDRRFAFNVGHDVPKDLIRDNFVLGAKKLEIYHKEFDRIIIFDNKLTTKERFPRKLLEMQKGKCTFVSSYIPQWFEKVFPDLDKEIKSQKKVEVKKNKGFSM